MIASPLTIIELVPQGLSPNEDISVNKKLLDK